MRLNVRLVVERPFGGVLYVERRAEDLGQVALGRVGVVEDEKRKLLPLRMLAARRAEHREFDDGSGAGRARLEDRLVIVDLEVVCLISVPLGVSLLAHRLFGDFVEKAHASCSVLYSSVGLGCVFSATWRGASCGAPSRRAPRGGFE